MRKLTYKMLSHYIGANFLTLILLFISIMVNISSILYYFYRFNNFTFVLSLILAIIGTGTFIYFNIFKDEQQVKTSKIIQGRKWKDLLLVVPFLGIVFYLFKLLYIKGSLMAIYTPWTFLPLSFWLLLLLALLILFVVIYLKNRYSYFLIAILYLLFFSISFFVYRIAFGYDQLLHERAISDIYNFGLIIPKTIYYIGQYVLELSIFKIWPASLSLLDKMLVPFLSAILIPATIFFNFKRRGRENNVWTLLLFLILPFSIFTYTVPQNLAFLFLLVLLFFSFNQKFVLQKSNFFFLFSWAITIFFIHPLAGVPALIFVSILFSYHLNLKLKIVSFLRLLAYTAQIILLPLLLCLSGGRFTGLNISISSWIPKLLGQENVFLNFVYFFFVNKNIFLLFIFVLASIFVFKKGRKELKVFYFNSLTLMLSYLASLFIDFPFLSQIDKSSYAGRILILSFLFLIPVFYDMFICLLKRIGQEKKIIRIILSLFLLSLLFSSLYINYPRKDNYFNSRSFSVSENDFKAVRLIEEKKENDNYIVLANQQVGAAAIKELGFKRYFGPWFYYSVQTGGLTYDYYLKMIENPQKDLMKELMAQTGASGVYFVVNDYWWAFDRIVEEARVQADAIYTVSDGAIMIFYFKL